MSAIFKFFGVDLFFIYFYFQFFFFAVFGAVSQSGN